MPSKPKARTAPSSFNKYGFKITKRSSEASAQKAAVPSALTKAKAPSKVTKPRAPPRSAKASARSIFNKTSNEHAAIKTASKQAAAKPKKASSTAASSNAASSKATPAASLVPRAKPSALTSVVKPSTQAAPSRATKVKTEKPDVPPRSLEPPAPPAPPAIARPSFHPFRTSTTTNEGPNSGLALAPSAYYRNVDKVFAKNPEPQADSSASAGRLSSETAALPSAINGFTPPLAGNIPMRSRAPATALRNESNTSSAPTPVYLRQLRDAASEPNASTDYARTMQLALDNPSSSSPTFFTTQGGRSSDGCPNVNAGQEAQLPLSSNPANLSNGILRTKPVGSDTTATPIFMFTSLPPSLVASSGGFDEYVITTTCRVPRGSASVPEVLFALSGQVAVEGLGSRRSDLPGDPAAADDDNSDDEPLVNRVAARAAAARLRTVASTVQLLRRAEASSSPLALTSAQEDTPVSNAAKHRTHQEVHTAACVEHLRDVASEERKLARHMPTGARTPAPHRRGRSFCQLTPGRSKTPNRRTPTQRGTSLRKTPIRIRPAPTEPPTVRRKKTLDKIMKNMVNYHQRRYLFPRRQVFQQPIKENITLARLETFWGILSDLIARNKIFSRPMWDHWEYLGVCARLINEKIAAPDKFGMAESDAAAKELMRQRMIIYTKDGKVMLTKNALSTRLS